MQTATSRGSRSPYPAVTTVVAVGSIITVAFTRSVIVTPLYPLYLGRFGFSKLTLTLVYAV